MITLDTSGVISLVNARDHEHQFAKAALENAGRPYLLPIGILAEITYLLEARMPNVLDTFLGDVEAGSYTQDCGEERVPRVRELMRRYQDLPLGFADATVIACAEQNGGLVLTLDQRDFGVVAREGKIRIAPN